MIMNLKCLIVDDEPLARKLIKEYLDEVSFITICGEAGNVISAKEILKTQNIDLMFLDINMPGVSGIDFVRILDHPPIVIYATAYPDYAVDAFELEAFDYLVKPISKERFQKTVIKLKAHLEQADGIKATSVSIRIKEGKRIYKVDPKEIFVIQAYGDYVKIYTTSKVYVSKAKLLEFCKMLPNQFIQVHRSNFINLNHVNYLEGNLLKVGEHKITVSSTYRQQLLDSI